MECVSGYTLDRLREAILKALGMYTENGERVSTLHGHAADMEERLLDAINLCAHRVCMSFPLLSKTQMLSPVEEKGRIYVALPTDVFRVLTVEVQTRGERRRPSEREYCVQETRLYWKGDTALVTVFLTYTQACPQFDEGTPGDTVIPLPAVTVDALMYLTAAELCPVEEAERYTRLVYAYRDLALNVYNVQTPTHGRNTFYTSAHRRFPERGDRR